MQNLQDKIQSAEIYKALHEIKEEKWDLALARLEKSLKEAEKLDDPVNLAVHESVLGLLFKSKKDFKLAWRHYEKAEKHLPDDAALKIISSRLLFQYFGQFDTVIKKMERVLILTQGDLTFAHPAYSLMGQAYLKKGNKTEAEVCLKKSMGDKLDFAGLQTATNLDFGLIEALMKKKTSQESCKLFLTNALAFSKKTRESKPAQLIEKLLKLFPT